MSDFWSVLLQSLEPDSDSEEDMGGGFSDMDSVWDDGEIEVSPEDEAAMAAFLNPAAGFKQRTLADIILEKIQEKQERQAAIECDFHPPHAPLLVALCVTIYQIK